MEEVNILHRRFRPAAGFMLVSAKNKINGVCEIVKISHNSLLRTTTSSSLVELSLNGAKEYTHEALDLSKGFIENNFTRNANIIDRSIFVEMPDKIKVKNFDKNEKLWYKPNEIYEVVSLSLSQKSYIVLVGNKFNWVKTNHCTEIF